MGRGMKFVDVATVDPADPGGSLITAPAERWDVIVDFRGFAGKRLILYNDAPAPYPGGADENDVSLPGNTGPGTRTIMRFDVAPSITGKPDGPLFINPATPLALNPFSGIDRPLAGIWSAIPLPPPPGVKVRNLTLNEVSDEYGRLIQMLGTNTALPLPAGFTSETVTNYVRSYDSPTTETPRAGATEVWRIANLTADTHPMHFHLANAQLLSRQPFDEYVNGVPTGLGKPRGPDRLELGWKETIKMNPDEVTTIIMKFDLPRVPFVVPPSPRTGGHEYVWHCHILEHEEHDMMRPMVVT
jgi:spore coat protein A, manganese oxidase